MQLIEKEGLEIIFLGGRLSKESQIALGGNVIHTLSEIKFDTCFLTTSYLDSSYGLSEFGWEVVQNKLLRGRAIGVLVGVCFANNLVSDPKRSGN